jgi:hypothetical protein
VYSSASRASGAAPAWSPITRSALRTMRGFDSGGVCGSDEITERANAALWRSAASGSASMERRIRSS